MQENVPPTHFYFKEYKKAFETYREYANTYGAVNVQLVVSGHPYSAGYWVESSSTEIKSELDHRYYGNLEIERLEKRVLEILADKKIGKTHSGLVL